MEYSIFEHFGTFVGLICIYMFMIACITYFTWKSVVPKFNFIWFLEFIKEVYHDKKSD